MQLLLHLMAIDAGYTTGFVRAASPEQVRAARMAIHANGILLGDGVGRILAEAHRNSVFAAARFNVRPSGTMAGIAAAPLLRGVRIRQHSLAHDRVLGSDADGVTSQTSVT
jgi:hypothetical protein